MARAATPRMTAESRREHLLDAAKELVAVHGFHGVSIEGVARTAGITRPIVYRHFDDLPALLGAEVGRRPLHVARGEARYTTRLGEGPRPYRS